MKELKSHLESFTDAQLVSMLKTDDRAFGVLFRRYQPRLLHFVNGQTGDPFSSEEIVQSFFMDFYVKRERLLIRSSLSAYLYVSLRNRTMNYLRNQHIYKKHLLKACAVSGVAANEIEAMLDVRELEQHVGALIDLMPVKQREVLLLKTRERYTVRQISFILERPMNTVEKQLSRAVRYLRAGMNRQKNIMEWR